MTERLIIRPNLALTRRLMVLVYQIRYLEMPMNECVGKILSQFVIAQEQHEIQTETTETNDD